MDAKQFDAGNATGCVVAGVVSVTGSVTADVVTVVVVVSGLLAALVVDVVVFVVVVLFSACVSVTFLDVCFAGIVTTVVAVSSEA